MMAEHDLSPILADVREYKRFKDVIHYQCENDSMISSGNSRLWRDGGVKCEASMDVRLSIELLEKNGHIFGLNDVHDTEES